MQKMKAVIYDKKASPDKLIMSDVDKPIPKNNEVLIKIKAFSLNAADYRSMKMGLIPKRKIFGADIAGVVEAVGSDITRFKPGDEVMGDLANFGFGGCAEYVAVSERAVISKPRTVSFEDAAALPLAGVTALQALRKRRNITKGDKVLIVGCAGGVGTYAIQLAKFFGAEVTGVCSTKNIQQSIELGANHMIDYTSEVFYKSDVRYDLILGVNGDYPLSAYRKCLTSNGTYIMVGGSLSQIFKSLAFGWLLSFRSKKMVSLAAKPNLDDLEFLAKLLEAGKISPVIDRRYSFEKTAEAMNYLIQGHSSGKVVITI